ncbi:MAG: 6-phosphogluconolactonase [Spirochaetales bacterium]
MLRFSDEAAWISAIVADFQAAIQTAIDRGQSAFNANLSGGGTPEPVYRALAAAPLFAALGGRIDIHLWVGDEREVPADSPHRNGRMIASAFGVGKEGAGEEAREGKGEREGMGAAAAARAAAAPTRGRSPIIHSWPEGDRLAACTVYSQELRNALGILPIFDLAVLGMGVDGHTAGLFSIADIAASDGAASFEATVAQPGNPPIAMPTTAPFEPRLRMTLAASVLKRSRATMILARGSEKAATLDAIAKGGLFPIVLATGQNALFYYLEL